MAILIVTHPHSFDQGIIKQRLVKTLKSTKAPSYFLRDGRKKAYGEGLYSGELKPKKDGSLKKYGRAPLQDKDADKIVRQNNSIFLAGGYLSECLPSTYNSLVRAAERNKQPITVYFVTDLIYVKKGSQTVLLREILGIKDQKKLAKVLNKKLQMYKESKQVEHEFVTSQALTQ